MPISGCCASSNRKRSGVDLVVGTSVGSLIGALYADSGRVLDAEVLALLVTQEDLFDYGALAFFSGGLAKGEGIETFLRRHLKHQAIEEFAVSYGAVATELRTGKTVVFDRGAVAPAVPAPRRPFPASSCRSRSPG